MLSDVVDRRYQLRAFAPSDQDAVRSLVLAGLRDHWGSIDESLNPDLHDIASAYENGQVVVAESHHRIVGTGAIRPRDEDAAEIVRMSVAASERRRGLGRLIVETLFESARAWGKTRVVLETSSDWDDAIAFYLACGFHVTHQVHGEFGRDTWFEYRP